MNSGMESREAVFDSLRNCKIILAIYERLAIFVEI